MKQRPDNGSWANDYVGIPFAEMGRDATGADCYGLVRLVLREQCNIILPDYLHESKGFDLKSMAVQIRKESINQSQWIPVLKGQEQAFDVIVSRTENMIGHVGIIIMRGKMLHVAKGYNAVTENYTRGEWKAPGKIIGIYRHVDLCSNR